MPNPEGNSQLKKSECTQPYEHHAELANVLTVLQMENSPIRCKYTPSWLPLVGPNAMILCFIPDLWAILNLRRSKGLQTVNNNIQTE